MEVVSCSEFLGVGPVVHRLYSLVVVADIAEWVSGGIPVGEVDAPLHDAKLQETLSELERILLCPPQVHP